MVSDERKNWRAVKETHKAALKASGINFNSRLGEKLDKMYDQIGKRDKKATAIANEALHVVGEYETKIKNMGNPAEDALHKELEKIRLVLADVAAWRNV
jgi:hypothetical protein